jgi:hypothetical protein
MVFRLDLPEIQGEDASDRVFDREGFLGTTSANRNRIGSPGMTPPARPGEARELDRKVRIETGPGIRSPVRADPRGIGEDSR